LACSRIVTHIFLEENKIALQDSAWFYDEMLCNSSLTEHYVQDLNKAPDLVSHFGKGTVNAVICNLSVQYILKTMELLQQILQVLVPGGTVHFTWVEDVFAEKSWAASRNWERQEITKFISSWFFALDGFENVQEWLLAHGNDLEHQLTYLTCIEARKAKE
jgi:SAM-dependent methyltransferase